MSNQLESVVKIVVFASILAAWYFISKKNRKDNSKRMPQTLSDIGCQNIIQEGRKFSGELSNRNFEIDPQYQGPPKLIGSTYITVFTLSSTHKGSTIVFSPRFFNDFPNWDAVSKESEIPRLRSEGESEKFKESFEAILTRLDQEYGPLRMFLGECELRVQPETIILCYPSFATYECPKLLQFLKSFAEGIESENSCHKWTIFQG